jgi:acetyl-CoA carboxylase biotin carboxyl carrier protein
MFRIPPLEFPGFAPNSIDNPGETLLNGKIADQRNPANHNPEKENALATIIEAPMVGKILKVEKQVGDRVEEDDVVLVMEAMKMEIPIVAPVSGVLSELKVSPGQAVEAEQELATIE